MKFQKLNKINEDFFDEVENIEEPVVEENSVYLMTISFNAECGTRESRWFVNLMPFDMIFNKLVAVLKNMDIIDLGECLFETKCEKYSRVFYPGKNNPSISEYVTQIVDSSRIKKKYMSSKSSLECIYKIEFDINTSSKKLDKYKKAMSLFDSWYSYAQHLYSSITVDNECKCTISLCKNRDEVATTGEYKNFARFYKDMFIAFNDGEELDDSSYDMFQNIKDKNKNIKYDWVNKFKRVCSKVAEFGKIVLKDMYLEVHSYKNCRLFVYECELNDNIDKSDFLKKIYDETVGSFTYFEKVCCSDNCRHNQEKVIIVLSCKDLDENFSYGNNMEYASMAGTIQTDIYMINDNELESFMMKYK